MVSVEYKSSGIKNTDAEIRDGVWGDSTKANGADAGINYFEQLVPLAINKSQTLTNAAADKAFITANTRGAEKKGVLEPILRRLSKKDVGIIKSAVGSYAPTDVDLIEKIDDVKEITR